MSNMLSEVGGVVKILSTASDWAVNPNCVVIKNFPDGFITAAARINGGMDLFDQGLGRDTFLGAGKSHP